MLGLCVGDREACADCQCGELIDRIAARAPVRKVLVIEALGHTRVPFAGCRADHRAGVELAAIETAGRRAGAPLAVREIPFRQGIHMQVGPSCPHRIEDLAHRTLT
jgi:hypothetical protein